MNLSKPLVPQHADRVLRVYCPKRPSTVMRNAAAVDAERQDAATWLGGEYAGPVAYCVPPGDSDTSISSLVTMIDNGTCDLVLVGEMRDLTRNPTRLWMFVHHCIDNEVRLIAWREGIDTANDHWELSLCVAVLRLDLFRHTKRRRKGLASPKS